MILSLDWIPGFVSWFVMFVYLESSVDFNLFRWEIKLRRILRRTFFVPAEEDEIRYETSGYCSLEECSTSSL